MGYAAMGRRGVFWDWPAGEVLLCDNVSFYVIILYCICFICDLYYLFDVFLCCALPRGGSRQSQCLLCESLARESAARTGGLGGREERGIHVSLVTASFSSPPNTAPLSPGVRPWHSSLVIRPPGSISRRTSQPSPALGEHRGKTMCQVSK